MLETHDGTEVIEIEWKRRESRATIFEAYRRWIDYWKED